MFHENEEITKKMRLRMESIFTKPPSFSSHFRVKSWWSSLFSDDLQLCKTKFFIKSQRTNIPLNSSIQTKNSMVSSEQFQLVVKLQNLQEENELLKKQNEILSLQLSMYQDNSVVVSPSAPVECEPHHSEFSTFSPSYSSSTSPPLYSEI